MGADERKAGYSQYYEGSLWSLPPVPYSRSVAEAASTDSRTSSSASMSATPVAESHSGISGFQPPADIEELRERRAYLSWTIT